MIKQRVEAIDLLRGLIIMIMTVDHVREFFYSSYNLNTPMSIDETPIFLFLTRILTHFCAPIFVVLAGISASLYTHNHTEKAAQKFLLTRGLFLIILELTVVNFAWLFTFSPEMMYLQVIWAIGWSMVALSLLMFLPMPFILLISVGIFSGHNFLPDLSFDNKVLHTVWAVIYKRDIIDFFGIVNMRTSYPILPWIGIMGFGYSIGSLYHKHVYPRTRIKYLLSISLILGGLFIFFRISNIYGEISLFIPSKESFLATIMSLFNLTKYPPSFLFTLMTLSGGMFFLVLCEKFPLIGKKIILTFGRASLVYYIIHLYIIHIMFLTLFYLIGEKPLFENITIIWGIATLCLILSYLPLRHFIALKKTSNNKIFSYF